MGCDLNDFIMMPQYETLLMKHPEFRIRMIKPLRFTPPAAAAPGKESITETLAARDPVAQEAVRAPGGRRGRAHQRKEVGVTVLETGAVRGGVGVPVAVGGRVAHGDPLSRLLVVGAVKAAVCRIRSRGGVILL